jgi:hemerythrin-like metal-binding protein
MAVVWREEYSVDDPDIDEQHQQIFQYLADLEENMKIGVDDAYMRRFLTALGIYTRSHFCFEEILMRRRACPTAAKNKKQHKALLKAYSQVLQRFETEGISEDLVQELHDFLENWLVHHILHTDMSLRDCANVNK